MKHLIILSSLFFSFLASAQDLILPTNETGEVVYTEAIALDSSYLKGVLYTNAMEWISSNYKTANDVVQNKDQETGIITIVALTPVGFNSMGMFVQQGDMKYTLTIYIKNGKYKYEIKNIHHIPPPNVKYNYGTPSEMLKEDRPSVLNFNTQLLTKMDNDFNVLIASLKAGMKKKPNTDW